MPGRRRGGGRRLAMAADSGVHNHKLRDDAVGSAPQARLPE